MISSSNLFTSLSVSLSSIWVCLRAGCKGAVPGGVCGEQLTAGADAGIFGEGQDWLGDCAGGGEHLLHCVARDGGGDLVEVQTV